MKIVKQLALFLENKPGTLSKVCSALAAAKVNICAISVSDAVDHAVVRMVVDDFHTALHLLGEHGVLVVERDVLMLEGRNKPGELAEIAAKLARNKVNIEYAYSATPVNATTGAMILRVDNPKKAAQILKGH
ncbi:MAG TPA: ACT domain-containing protein [Verrucomicrobiae bacterium]|nr:ACT domain-containing protein [Verrucomicrobiae bacterium]